MKSHLIKASLAAAVLFGVQAQCDAASADFPTKMIEVVVPFSPGGATDALARMLGENMSKSLGQPVIVDNKPGAGGAVGASFVAKAPADGYTLLLGTSGALAVNQHLYRNLPYEPERDFAPVVLATVTPNVLVVNAASKIHSVRDLIQHLAQNPGKVNYASSGIGTPSHLGAELFSMMTKTRANHVPYKGGVPALTDLAGGQLEYMFAILSEAQPLVDKGLLRIVAVTTKERLPSLPKVPTVAESGVPGYELISWSAFVAPAATPAPVLAKLNRAFTAALADPAIAAKVRTGGVAIVGGAPEVLKTQMSSESRKWRDVIDTAGIKAD